MGRVNITYAESKGPDINRSVPWHTNKDFGTSPKRSPYTMPFFRELGVHLRARAQIAELHVRKAIIGIICSVIDKDIIQLDI
jgi:hypothetical protein